MQGDASRVWQTLTALPPPAAVADVPALQIWCVDLAALVPEEDQLALLLDETEHAEVLRLRQPRDRQRLRLRRGLRRMVLGRHLDRPPALLRFERGPQGQPLLAGLAFSSSCSGDWLLLALTRGAAVGVDVECVAGFRFTPALAGTCCSRAEQQRLQALPEPLRAAEFLRNWTAKEALLKLRGTGFREEVDLPGLLEALRPHERVIALPAGPALVASLAVAPLRTA
jgi:4'-phosphopantetheinyl transferase